MPEPASGFTVNVATDSGDVRAFRVNPLALVDCLRAEVRNWLHESDVCLKYGLMELEDGRPLVAYKVRPGCTIRSSVRMTLTVVTDVGLRFSFSVKPDDTISMVKTLIERQLAVSPIVISLVDQPLDMNRTLSSYCIANRGTLNVRMGVPFCVKVRTWTGKEFAILVRPDESVDELKDQITAKGEYSDRLTFEGNQLQTGHMLRDYGITRDSVVHVARCPINTGGDTRG